MCHKKVNTVMLSGVHFGFAVRLVSLNTLTFLTEVYYLIQPKELSKTSTAQCVKKESYFSPS
jgi:hypothetical protein